MPIYYHETIDASIVREKALAYLDKVGQRRDRAHECPGFADAQPRQVGGELDDRPLDPGCGPMGDDELGLVHRALHQDQPDVRSPRRPGAVPQWWVRSPPQAVGGNPTLDEIIEEGRRAPFVLQETIGVPAGSAPVYLESLDRPVRSSSARSGGCSCTAPTKSSYVTSPKSSSNGPLPTCRPSPERSAIPGGFTNSPLGGEARATERTYIAALLEPTEWSPLR